jgi:uncharacterized protein YbjT (DUF2867 family)
MASNLKESLVAKKTYAVAGATGHVGKVVVERLERQGHQVRRIARSAGVDIDDGPALARAYQGADGAFLLIPPEYKAANLRAWQNDVGAKLFEAVKTAKVRRVIFLSNVNADYELGTGIILGLHDMEGRLNGLGIPELVHLRPAMFMESHLSAIELIARSGVYGGAFKPNTALPMIAAKDVGEIAAELLTEEPFQQPRIRALLGPRDYTMTETARVLGTAIGKPDLKYVQLPYENMRKAMLGMGVSASYVDAVLELVRSFNDGKLLAMEQPRSAQNTTSTTLQEFADKVFRKAYEAMTAAGSAGART